jgi:hypothetical protein
VPDASADLRSRLAAGECSTIRLRVSSPAEDGFAASSTPGAAFDDASTCTIISGRSGDGSALKGAGRIRSDGLADVAGEDLDGAVGEGAAAIATEGTPPEERATFGIRASAAG